MRRLTAVVILAAASAVSGCVTVSQPAAGPGGGLISGQLAPSAAGGPAPIVQAPAHEALASVRPEPADSPRPKAAPRRHVAPPVRPQRPAAGPAGPRPRAAVSRAGTGGANVCDMGEAYGGWAGQGDAARICRQAYRGRAYGN
ncbi:hypothetical protein [Streptomyces sp. NBC_01262]|uniref:hypothetical protein n=1 Tax=Streptomyces sp. NBC_01262 TaxID=2903803 RepID=UPI002E2FB001|nr:hypothetical protein [Streptomyces sp. NBC_01262]